MVLAEVTTDIIKQEETIKLTKNTKGYGWDIKIFKTDGDDKWLDRLEEINNELVNRFGE